MSDSYTIDDLTMRRELIYRWAGWYTSGGLTAPTPQGSNLQYLIERGHHPEKAAKAAISWDDSRYASRYREVFVPADECEPELSRRDHLVQECGYAPHFVDAYLTEAAAKDAERERQRLEREAYERTWRYKTITGWREFRYRLTAAWQIIRHGQEDDQ